MDASVRAAALLTLALDRAAGEVVVSLRAAGVPSIVLKGPSFATWLYGADEFRAYSDVDVLVPDDRWNEARAVLRQLGYRPLFKPTVDPPHASAHRRRGESVTIDLHRTLQGLTEPPMRLWDVLSDHTVEQVVGGTTVAVLDKVGRCLHVAIHAGRADASGVRAREDLGRALRAADAIVWHEAEALARGIGGAAAFAAGLGVSLDGGGAARDMGLGVAEPQPTGSRGLNTLDRLRRARGLTDRVALVWPWLVPRPAAMRQVRPSARQGRWGLALAYVTHGAWLVAAFARAVIGRDRSSS